MKNFILCTYQKYMLLDSDVGSNDEDDDDDEEEEDEEEDSFTTTAVSFLDIYPSSYTF